MSKRAQEVEEPAAPNNGAPLARARPNIAAVVAIVDHATDLLSRGMNPRAAARELQQRYKFHRNVSYRYVGVALKRLTTDATLEPIESKRARHIATLERRMRRADENKRVFEQNGETVEYDAPDFKAANAAQAMLIQLDGTGGTEKR